ncbi:MAG: SRPBCC family protein [Candidatus Acidiferrales bacterium]
MSGQAKATATRTIEKRIEIDAPVEAVWKALTEGEELARWFPLEARVELRIGGTFFVSWGPQCEGEGKIHLLEINRRFGWLEPAPPAPGAQPGDAPVQAAVEWILEGRGGKTVLRLVNSGIAAADWAHEYFESLDYGWGFMLANLRFYLERHRGSPRGVAWPRRKVHMRRETAWKQLLASPAFREIIELLPRRQGDGCRVRLAGDVLDGSVEFVVPPKGFCIRANQLNGSLLWLSLEGGAQQTEVGFWLSAYGVRSAELAAFEKRWVAALETIFPEGQSATLAISQVE